MKTQIQAVEKSSKEVVAQNVLKFFVDNSQAFLKPNAAAVLSYLLKGNAVISSSDTQGKQLYDTVVASSPTKSKKTRGRPKGSKNKNKESLSTALMKVVTNSPGLTLPALMSLLPGFSKQSVATTLFNLKRQEKISTKGTRRNFTYIATGKHTVAAKRGRKAKAK